MGVSVGAWLHGMSWDIVAGSCLHVAWVAVMDGSGPHGQAHGWSSYGRAHGCVAHTLEGRLEARLGRAVVCVR